MLRWYELRWSIERFFHALKVGTRIEDRRLVEADDLRKCRDHRVPGLGPLPTRTREAGRPGQSTCHRGRHIRALCALAAHYGFKAPRGPPEMTIAGFVVLTGGLAGFHPSKRQPLPGTRKLWEGVRFLSNAVIAIQAMQEWTGQTGKEKTRS